MKRLLVILVLCSFGFQQLGCTGIMVHRAQSPAETIQYPEQRHEVMATTPYEIKREVVVEKVEIISEIPPGNYPNLKLGVRPVSPVDKNTVAKLEDEARKSGKMIFLAKEKILLDTKGGDGRWYRGWVPAGTVFLVEIKEEKDDIVEYTLRRIGFCWNEVRGVTVRVYPKTVKIIERYLDTVVVKQTVERYRDIDYTPAIWAGIIWGMAGWLIRPEKEVMIRTITPPGVITR